MPGPARAEPTAWRSIRTPPLPGPENMALDVALARCRRPGEAVLRIYGWHRPTLSFGRNQPAAERYRETVAVLFGGNAVRRPTGGREVLHDRELTFAVIVPARGFGGPRAIHRRLGEALLEAVRSLGAEADLAGGGRRVPRPEEGGACFGRSVENEIEAGGRKLVGSAQARLGGSVLEHGSIPLAHPTVGPASLREAGGSLSDALGRAVSFPSVATAVEAALIRSLGGRWRRSSPTDTERRTAASLVPRFASPAWTWRL